MQDRIAVREAAKIIAISIRTSPKSAGVDDIAYSILSDIQKKKVAHQIRRIAGFLKKVKPKDAGKAIDLDWHSDASAVEKSDCLILIGVKGRRPLGLDCQGCGFKDCQDFAKTSSPKSIFMPGPFCIFKLWDLGIAIASAAKCASSLNIDNRIMFKVGAAAYRLGLLKGYNPILGLPLSASGKNIYFDRREKLEAKKILEDIKKAR